MTRCRFFLLGFLVGGLFLSGCSSVSNLCRGFTELVEPARASYFSEHRIYPLNSALEQLAQKYKPRLIVHPMGLKPIDFSDYMASSFLVNITNQHKTHLLPLNVARADFSDQCNLYVESTQQTISSHPPYPWYVQIFRGKAPGDIDEQWTYIKYNIVFDWSGLAVDMGWMSRAGIFLLGADPTKWHRLDVHTTVIIAVDEEGVQRFVTINQHNYARTYLGGRDYDMNKTIVVTAALHSNELYLDQGWEEPQRFNVVRFYDSIPYLISGEDKPRFTAADIVWGIQAGGTEVATKIDIIDPSYPLAAFAGLLAPPNRLWGRVYIGRDGPMGYDYYSLPSAVPFDRLAALGYWSEGEQELAEDIQLLLDEISSFEDKAGWDRLIDFMEIGLVEDLKQQKLD